MPYFLNSHQLIVAHASGENMLSLLDLNRLKVFLPKCWCVCRWSIKRCKPDSSTWKSVDCCLFLSHPSTHIPTALFPCCWQEGRASAKPMCQLELMAILYAASLWVNGRGQARVSVQEASKLTGSMKQELSKEISSLGFDMKWVIVLDLALHPLGLC